MVDKKYILLFLLLAPYALLALVYFGMGFLEPNYMVNEVHISQPYNFERQLFGIATADGIKTPSEWFAAHHSIGVDLVLHAMDPIANLLLAVSLLQRA